MKYMIILFGDESTYGNFTEDQVAADMERHGAFGTWCEGNDVAIIGGEELHLSPSAKTFRTDGTETDGPFLELKEQLGGYYIIETDSRELAEEAARHAPSYGAIELRQVVEREEA
ncbi:MAG: YciI family protein [Thermomicrobiales bacterium]|nr:YciI family protein [Thermomicrobiales bacterium]